MLEEILKAIPVLLISMVKFFLGPVTGYGLKLNPVATAIATLLGMMTSVVAFTYFTDWLKRGILKKFFTKTTDASFKPSKIKQLLSKYGLGGVAFFTPLILTPIPGTILAVSLGSPRPKILLYMFISGLFWSIFFTFLLYSYGDVVIDFFKSLWPF
jgi:membrane protein DedA with SNARE-associated domain